MTNAEIEAFLAISRLKTISRAAEELYISQSSLSARLKTLEEELGFCLMQRSRGTREITLTPRGRSFHELALQYTAIENKMKNIGKTDMKDSLKVSVLDSVGNYMFSEVFRSFTEQYPDIRLTVQDMDAEMASVSILRGRTDLAFNNTSIQTEQIVTVPFLAEPYVIIASEEKCLPEQTPLEMLAPGREIFTAWSNAYTHWHNDTFGGDSVPLVEVDLMAQIGIFVSGSENWAIVPRSLVDGLIRRFPIRMSRPAFSVPERVINVLMDREKTREPAVQAFLETARRILRETMPEIRLL